MCLQASSDVVYIRDSVSVVLNKAATKRRDTGWLGAIWQHQPKHAPVSTNTDGVIHLSTSIYTTYAISNILYF